jgi:hypothetical protein
MSNQALVAHLEHCVERARSAPLSIGAVFDELGRDGIAMVLIILNLPFLQPLTLGPVASAGGLVIAGIGWQMARGNETLWLPQKMRDSALNASAWEKLLGACRWLVVKFARFTRTRHTQWTDGERGHRIAGWFAVVGGLLLAFPMFGMPFGNMLPALVVVCACIAVLERDGLMYFFATFWALLMLAYMGTIAYLLIFFGAEFKEWIAAYVPSWLG